LIGVSIYAFEAIGLVFHIRNSLKETSEFVLIFRYTNLILVVLQILFSITGSFAFGHKLKDIYLFSLPNDRLDVKFV